MEALKKVHFDKRAAFEWERAFYSLRKSPVPAILLFQIGVYFYVNAKGAGKNYMDMIGILMAITIGAWIFTAYIQGNEKIVIYSVILLTTGTMLQCIFLEEQATKTGTVPAHPAGELQLQYLIAFAAAIGIAVIYRCLPKIASLKCCRIIFVVFLGLTLFTLLFAVAVGNVKNWIRIGNISVQTTELDKIIYILLAAGLLGTGEKAGKERVFSFMGITALMVFFLFLQGELGTLLLIILIYLLVLFLFLEDMRYFAGSALFLAAASTLFVAAGKGISGLYSAGNFLGTNPLARSYLRGYTKLTSRFLYWLHPEKDPLGLGYQLLKARESIVLGGWFGTASVTELPVKSSDLVFPALIQRCGVVFALLVFVLFILLWLEGLKIFIRKEDRYHQMIGASCSFMLFFQTLIIITGSTGLCPLTGITLPLISRGGSSLVISFMLLSLLISVSGNVAWEGVKENGEEAFIKENKITAKLKSGLRDTYHSFSGKNFGRPSRSLGGSGQGKEEGTGESPRKGIYKGKHNRQGRGSDRLIRKAHGGKEAGPSPSLQQCGRLLVKNIWKQRD